MYIIMFEGVRPGEEESEHGLSHLKHREITFDKIKNILKIKTSQKFDSQLNISLKIKEEKYHVKNTKNVHFQDIFTSLYLNK